MFKLFRAPGFLLLSSAILILGIGTNTAVYTAAEALVLQPLPYPRAEQLVALHERLPEGAEAQTSLAALPDYQAAGVFAAAAAGRQRSFGVQGAEGAPVQVMHAGMVTEDWFTVLGVQPRLGRGWKGEEPVVVLGDEAWGRLFQRDPGALGKRVLVNGQPMTVAGIMPAEFRYTWGTEQIAFWMPIAAADYGGRRDLRAVDAIARLAVPREQASAAMGVLAKQWDGAYPEQRGGGIGLRDLREEQQGRYHRPMAILTAGAGLLTLIAGANLAYLILVRFAFRRRELAIRLALGARRRDVTGEFFGESAAIALLGTAGGWLLSEALLRAMPYRVEADWHSAAFAAGAGMTAALTLPLLPLWKTRSLPLEAEMREGSAAAGSGVRAARTRRWVVAAEVAVSVTLLAGCLLLARSLQEMLRVDPGFTTERVYRFGLGIPEGRYDTPEKMAGLYPKLEAELRSIPGMEATGVGLRLPLSGSLPKWRFTLAGGAKGSAVLNLATTGYFEVLGLRASEGRLFREREEEAAAIVNEAWVRRYGRGPGTKIGFRWNEPAEARIVGVVGDTRQQGLTVPAHPEVYLDLRQFPSEGMQVVVRAAREDEGLRRAMARAVQRVDPDLEGASPAPLRDWVAQSAAPQRTALGVSGALALTAMVLAGIGLYGVVAAAGEQRRREMAVRSALGATPNAILGLVLGQSIRYTGWGLTLGMAGYFAAAGWLRSEVYGVREWDIGMLAGVLAGVGMLAVTAGLGPALRARQINPGKELR